MAHGIVILECPRTPQSEVWARSYGVFSGALPRDSAQLCECYGDDSTSKGMTPGSPEAWEGHNSMNTCSNGVSEESIGISTKSRCQWSGRLIHVEPKLWRYGRLKPQGLRHQRNPVVSKTKCVLEVLWRGSIGGLPKTPKSTIEEDGLPLHSHVSRCD